MPTISRFGCDEQRLGTEKSLSVNYRVSQTRIGPSKDKPRYSSGILSFGVDLLLRMRRIFCPPRESYDHQTT